MNDAEPDPVLAAHKHVVQNIFIPFPSPSIYLKLIPDQYDRPGVWSTLPSGHRSLAGGVTVHWDYSNCPVVTCDMCPVEKSWRKGHRLDKSEKVGSAGQPGCAGHWSRHGVCHIHSVYNLA